MKPIVATMVQVLAVLFAMQLSGLAHGIADALFHDDCSNSCEHRSGRGDDANDSECPPGCPACHSCAHVQAPYVPELQGVASAPLDALAPCPDYADRQPPRPELPSIFRPPRA
jgi:hypothetical protein